MRDPKAIRKAIMTAKSVARLIDPHFGRVPLPELGGFGADEPVIEHSPMIHAAYDEPMPDHFAAGGGVGDENPYAQPNDMGFYSQAAVSAADLPKSGSPDQMKEILLRRPGIKPSEFEWSGYDEAFADQPQITRQQMAEHFHGNLPPVEEKVFQKYPHPHEEKALSKKRQDIISRHQAAVREDANYDPGGDRWNQIMMEAQAERNEMRRKYDPPHHEQYTIPGGKHYREILLKHGGEEQFRGVDVHFKGEPNVLASMMVKDRQDHEGDNVMHIDELQSDWAQKGRGLGFDKPLSEREIYTIRYPDGTTEYNVPGLQEAQRAAAEGGGEYELSMTKPARGIDRAPYVTKTEDWVDLALKRAFLEAAERGHDKLAWSPGSIIADRYNLAKHVGDIHHEKNDDGTYNLIVRDHDGDTILKEDEWEPKKLGDYFGKGVADRILAGEGESGKEAYDKHFEARNRVNNFLDMAADKFADQEVVDVPDEDRALFHRHAKKVWKNALDREPEKFLGELGLLDDYKDVHWDLQDAEKALKEAPIYSPYRDWRRLSNLDLQVGEKWPFEMYDRMIPKRALRLAKQHDPDAQLVKSIIKHPDQHYDDDEWEEGVYTPNAEQTELQAIKITPKMRESIRKNGFSAHARGGAVDGYADGGEVDDHVVDNPMSIFPKPQRMWDEDMPGGAYLSMPDKQDVTGHRASSASIGIGEGGKPYFNASRDPAEVTGSPGRGSATVKTNLFKQKAGWKWLDTPEGHDSTNTLVSVEHRGKHHYVLHAHFPKGVDLARYPDAPSEPRLRPTTKGNVELGPQVGSISVRGKEHPVHAHAIVKAHGGEVEDLHFANGGDVDTELFKQYMKKIHSPLSEDPAAVQHALRIAQTYRTHTSGPMKFQTGTGGYYNVNQPMDVDDVTSTIRKIKNVTPKAPVSRTWEDFVKEGSGGTLVSLGGDRSNLGRMTHINGKKLAWPVDLHAGPKYMLEPNKGQVWANNKSHTAAFNSIIEEASKRGPVFGVYTPMGPQSVDSAHNMFDAVMAQIPDSEISAEDAKQFDEDLKAGKHFVGLAPDKAAAKAAKAMEKWPGILNAKKASKFARTLPGTHRSAIIAYMDKTPMLKKGFPAIGVTRAAITDSDVKGAQGNMIGHRIVRLSSTGSGEDPSFDHSTYTDPTHGEYWGDVPLVQRHYAMPRAVEQMVMNPTKAGQVVHPYSEEPRGRDAARGLFNFYKRQEPVDQRMLDSVMMGMENQEKYGFKKGGAVRKALMIAKGVKKK